MPIRLLPKIMERKSRFRNAPECGTYIAQYLQNYAGDRCFGRQPDRHGLNQQLSQQKYQPAMHKLDKALSNLEFDLATETLLELADTLNINTL